MDVCSIYACPIGALLAGVFILFRPELWRLLWGILGHPFSLGLLALSLALAAGFVFLGPAWWKSA